ncbi:unnamed protein product [Mycena citricolor]|uniref:Uncharacterized protein n=2 Tax=Mycena citricolor TaxID=2018698 RepID=A0AAD2HPR0_9AGAR|nr:unnamed protein product [Mycena citricolor]CAK5277877.1 unnamed protein product [Mycena citricolor]
MQSSAKLEQTAPSFCLYKLPPGVSKVDFDAQLNQFMDTMAQLPVVQENWATFELILQNDKLDGCITDLGLPAPQQCAILITHAHSHEHCEKLTSHPSTQDMVAAATASYGG